MDELPVALSGRDSWGVGTDLATEAEARAFGAKVRASLIPRSKITAATPMLHDRPLVVSYKGGSVTIPPPGIDLRHANRTFFEHAGKGYRDRNHRSRVPLGARRRDHEAAHLRERCSRADDAR
jgi:hypothetical protein